ncbi:MAG: RluA family pseudouridine synthase [Simkaniaceae bacterium]|nr:RluA family pseudouridine synthase [Simkaniaceae bacterium]
MDTYIVKKEDEGERLDKLLTCHFPHHSRTYFQYLIQEKSITINGLFVKKRERPTAGDEIQIFYLHSPETPIEPEDIALDILYEDEAILAINKPAGMVVHPASGNRTGTLVNALLYYVKSLKLWDESIRPGIVHRLDKDTSGIILVAKTIESHRDLIEQFSDRSIEKTYIAITLGNPKNGILSAPIGRHPKNRKEMTLLDVGGKEAITEIETLANREHLSYVSLSPKTGRTHQLRVHLKSCNAAVLGDSVYGNEKMKEKYGIKRQLLHAHQISFTHPLSKKRMNLSAEIPKDIQKWINHIEYK